MTHSLPQAATLRIPGYPQLTDTHLIAWLEGTGNYTTIHLKDNSRPRLVCQTLKHFELELPDFVRVSKSSLINPTFIGRLVREEAKKMHVTLTNGVRIQVSRRRILPVLAQLETFLFC